jgi:hypothetical protein
MPYGKPKNEAIPGNAVIGKENTLQKTVPDLIF